MVLGKQGIHIQKNEIGPLSNTIHKNELKMYERLTLIRPGTIKLLKENRLLGIGLGKDFVRYDTKSTGDKSKHK